MQRFASPPSRKSVDRSLLLLALIIATLLVPSCKEDDPVVPPVIHASLSPKSGNTTHTFNFDLSRSESRSGKGAKVFIRWDWDGDGTWDTPFTRILVYEHRYFAPGIWNPRLEMANLDGGVDTMSFTIPVARGYSPPDTKLAITPAQGHIFTIFQLDASATRDDEDSSNQLSFRWDFEGDGQWDTGFGDSAKISHQYPETGLFTPEIQVKDPSGLIGTGSSTIRVTLVDPRLQASFRCIPDSVTNNTPIILDASASYDPDNPDNPMQYRWDWTSDRIWDTEWLSDPKTEHVFKEEFFHFVRLEVRSLRGLTNAVTQKIRVYHKNQDPRASFAVSTATGNLNTRFRFDCWSTIDTESAVSDLFYRWDFDGDGNWDTDFANSVITMHQFDTPGTFKTMLLVKDPHGGQDTCSKVMHISTGTNKTDIYEDTHGYFYQSYGTVLIGKQWWFTRNLTTQDTAKYYDEPFTNSWPAYFYYGDLYTSLQAKACPTGWRLPSRQDWDKLFSNYPEDRLFEALMPGGESDFGADLGGRGSGLSATSAEYKELNKFGYYWSTTIPPGGSSTSVWIITFDNSSRKVLKGYFPGEKTLYSVRCVRDE